MDVNEMKLLIHNQSNDIVDLSVKMIYLEAIQNAVSQLMDRMDEIILKGWHKENATIFAMISEIEQNIRLIDFAFVSLYEKMEANMDSIKSNSTEINLTLDKLICSEASNCAIRQLHCALYEKRS